MFKQTTVIKLLTIFSLSLTLTIFIPQISTSQVIVQSLRGNTGTNQHKSLDLIAEAKNSYQNRQYSQAIQILNQAVESFASQQDFLNQSMALSNLALIYQNLGEWNQAEVKINESLTILNNQPDSIEKSRILAQTLDLQGINHREKNNSEAAIESWKKAEAIYLSIDEIEEAEESKLNQILAMQEVGLQNRACNTLIDILNFNSKTCQELSELKDTELTQEVETLNQIKAMKYLGDVLRLSNQLRESQLVLESSLNSAQKLANDLNKQQIIPSIYLSLGNTARSQELPDAALNYYQKAETATTDPELQLRGELNQLNLLIAQASWSKLPSILPKINSKIKQLPVGRAGIDTRLNLAQSLLCLEKATLSSQESQENSPLLEQCNNTIDSKTLPDAPEESYLIEILNEALQQAETINNQKLAAYTLVYLGAINQQQKNINEAINLTTQALSLIADSTNPEITYLSQWQLGRLYLIKGETTEAINFYNQSFNTLESLRGELIGITINTQLTFRTSVEPVYREYVDLLLKSANPSQENLKQARNVIEALQIAELNDFFRDACTTAQPQQIDELVQEAEVSTAFFYPIILKDRLEVIVAFSGDQTLGNYSTKINSTELNQLLNQLRIDLSIITRLPEVRSSSIKLYNWLIGEKIEAELDERNIKNLVFVLDGLLRNVPMAALFNEKTGQYLVEKYAIALAPSLQLLTPQPIAAVDFNLLIAGLSEERTLEQGSPFPELKYVEKEVQEIINIFPNNSRLLLNEDFVKDRLESELKANQFNLVHISTHGEFKQELNDIYVVSWNELLRIDDLESLFELNREPEINPIELLVFSACKTAAGDERTTLGIAGITVRAGARSAIAALWPVQDTSTTEFMRIFYEQLIKIKETGGLNKAEALRQTQITFIQDREQYGYTQPYYWASFILLGNWL